MLRPNHPQRHPPASLMATDSIILRTADGVATITLNRPDVLNSFNAGMAHALQAVVTGLAADDSVRAVLLTGAGAVLGTIFAVIQYFEWAQKPFTLSSSGYGSLYFTITGFHMAHVIVGVIMLWALCAWSLMGYFNRVRYVHIHIGALYWHFVDAVWLVVFFTFYLTPLMGLKS